MTFAFHFLRPWWFLALIPCALLVRAIRHREDAAGAWHGIVAPHLLPFLLQGHRERGRLTPLHLVALGWLVAVIAIAGPAWRREPAPFASDTAALAIVLKVSPSMMTEDVQPGRLTRSVEKVHDLLVQRRGANSSLIAYSGSAHVVMPATTDEGIIENFAQALNPKIMPSEGDAAADALRLADQTLATAGGGSILWIADSIAPEQEAPLAAWRKGSSTDLRLLPPLLPGGELDAMTKSAEAAGARIVRLSADDSDVTTLARAAKFAPVTASDPGNRWEESGYWLTPVIAAVLLPFFRRGWMTQTANRS